MNSVCIDKAVASAVDVVTDPLINIYNIELDLIMET